MSSEERVNTITHLIALVATLVIAWPLLRLAAFSQRSTFNYQLLGTALFLLGMFLMYGSSTLYHAVTAPAHKRRLRVFDHISIYIMIAGSYSPVCLTVIGGWIGWTLFGFLWGCVLAGVIGKVIALGRFPRLSLALYLMMGWVALLVLVPMWRNMSHEAFWCIIAEGVFYTLGSYFFNHDEQHAYYHAVWHVFIILGAAAHTVALWLVLAA
jgi:hemolysin III